MVMAVADFLGGIAGEFDIQGAICLCAYIWDDERILVQRDGDIRGFAGSQRAYGNGLAVLFFLTDVMEGQIGIAPSLVAAIDDAERSIVLCAHMDNPSVLDLFRIGFCGDGYGRASVVDGGAGNFCPAIQAVAVTEILGADIVVHSLWLWFCVSCWYGCGVR